jgi:hypothetical protein
MNKYIFKTTATMKPYNEEKWWIDPGIIREKTIEAENVNQALEKYKEIVEEKEFVIISANALKTKEPMYVDAKPGTPKQVGYVITGKTFFDNDNGNYTEQYIDLWVEILTVIDTEF